MQGEAQLDPTVASKVLNEFQRLMTASATTPVTRSDTDDDLIIEPLTPRENDVLLLLVEGLSNREIGARLFLTEGTIKNYVSAIIAKLQANDRTHAVVTAWWSYRGCPPLFSPPAQPPRLLSSPESAEP